MKNSKSKILFYVSVLNIFLLVALAITLIQERHLPYMAKYSFSILLTTGLCAFLVLTSNVYERITEHFNKDILKKKKDALKEAEQKLKTLQERVDKLKEQISAVLVRRHEEQAETDTELLRKKCEAIENFRNSFPYRIADEYILYNIIRTEIQVSEFSRWQLVGEFEGQLWEYTLLRPDTQSYKEMLSLAAATKAPAELSELNISEQLLWN